jgi:hypothetical protein
LVTVTNRNRRIGQLMAAHIYKPEPYKIGPSSNGGPYSREVLRGIGGRPR